MVTYTVTYNGNGNTGGTVPTDSTFYSSGSSVTVLGNTGSLEKTNYFFTGWNTKANGSGLSYLPGSTFIINADTTLYAYWSPSLLFVEVYSNITSNYIFSGYFEVDINNTVTAIYQTTPTPTDPFTSVLGNINSVLTVKPNANNDNKYDPITRFFSVNGVVVNPLPPSNNETSITLYDYKSGITYYEVQINYPGGVIETPKNLDVYYQITAVDNLYKLTYNGNGNTSGSAPNGSFNTGGSTVTVLGPESLEKTGTIFVGWNTASNGSGLSYLPDSTFIIIADTTLYAQWANTVTYDGNGADGGLAPDDLLSPYITNSLVTVLGNTGSLTKTNYTFSNWNTAADGSGSSYLPGSTFIISADTILYASWNCKVTYDGNGNTSGTVPTDDTFYQPGSSVTVLGTTDPLEKTDYIFNGWTIAQDGSGTKYYPDDTFTININTTLYAQWTLVLYTVTYDGNGNTGGTVPTDSTFYQSGSRVTVLGSGTLVKTDFTFFYWNTKADGKGTFYSPGGSFTIIADTTLYAYWAIKVTYNGNGNTDGTAPVDNTAYEPGYRSFALEPGSLVKADYLFSNWNTAADGSGTSYMPREAIYDLSVNITLYAQWVQVYTVTYDGNGNTGGTVPNESSYPSGSEVTVLGNTGSLTKTDYTFSNWNTAADGSGLSYLPGSTFIISADIILYASWNCKVTYDGNGNTSGTVPTDDTFYQPGSSVTVLGTTDPLEKTDYIFNGWTIAQDGSGTKYYPDDTFTININTTLYAQWTLVLYTVTYDGNGNTGGTVPTDSTFYQSGSRVTVLGSGTLVKTDFTFFYWNTKADGKGTFYSPGGSFTIIADTTLYAYWAIKVTYNGNGNTGGTAPVDNTAYEPGYRSIAKEPGSLVKVGYLFSNWNTVADGSGTSYVPREAILDLSVNITLYAQWVTAYTVTYDGNGNTGGTVPNESSYPSGSTVTVLGNTGSLEKTGSNFIGWNTEADGSGLSYSPGSTFSITTNTILYAQWDPSSFYVEVYSNIINKYLFIGYFQIDVNNNVTAVYQTSPTPTDPFTNVLGNINSVLTVKPNAKNDNKYDPTTGLFSRSGVLINPLPSNYNATSITLYNFTDAQYQVQINYTDRVETPNSNDVYYLITPVDNLYKLTYNGNGNTSGSAPNGSFYTGGSTVTVLGPGSLEKTGYNFTGWNTAADGSGTSYSPGNTFTITADTTLYAQWTLVLYTVTYNGNGNTGGTAPIDVLSPYPYGLPVPVLGNTGSLVKTNYFFAGWNTEADGSGLSYLPGSTFIINADTTLYAQWSPSLLSVEVYSNIDKYIFTGYFEVDVNNNVTAVYQTSPTPTEPFTSVLGTINSVLTVKPNAKNDNNYVPITRIFSVNGVLINPLPSIYNATSITLYNYSMDNINYQVQINYPDGAIKTPNSSEVYYIITPVDNLYKLTYNGNGNTSGSAPNGSFYTGGSTVTVLGSKSLERTNYTFSNWNTEADGSGLSYLPGSTFTINADTTLFAQWSPSLFYVYVYSNIINDYLFTGYFEVDINNSVTAVYQTSPTPTEPFTSVLGNIDSVLTVYPNANNDNNYDPVTGFFSVIGVLINPLPSNYNATSITLYYYTINDINYQVQINYTDSVETPNSSDVYYKITPVDNLYKLIYNGNGNTSGSAPNGSFYTGGSTVTVLGSKSLERTNYTFSNWNTEADGSGLSYSPGNTFTITADTTLFAQWTPVYTVTYDGNGNTGGTAPTDSTFYPSGSTVTVLGNTGSLVKTGFAFRGWNTAADGSGTKYYPDDEFIITEDTTLYAIWRMERYSVNYNGNGNTSGSGTIPIDRSSPYPSGSLVTVLEPGSLVRTNYTFSNWNTAANGSGTSYLPGITFRINENTTLFAQWTPVFYVLTYNGNGNTSGTVPAAPTTYQSGLTVTVLGNTGSLEKTGSTFVGWNTKADGSGSFYLPGGSFSIIVDTTLYARWTYTVTYNGNGNTGGTVPVDGSSPYLSGSLVTVLEPGSLVRTNYTFSNWNTAANGSGTSYSPGSTFTIIANTTLYAEWTPVLYTVTYNGNGNTGGTAPVDGSSPYPSGSSVTVLGNTGSLEKGGYIFVGWNTKANGSGSKYGPGNTFTITADTTLYAEWLNVLYTVTYDGNGNTGGTVPTDHKIYEFGTTVTVLGNTGSLIKTGFAFGGWNTKANGSGTSYSPGSTFTIIANTTLYAEWTPVLYTVTYNGNGNTGGTAPVDGSSPYPSGSSVTVLGNTGSLVKTGFAFRGWNTKANSSGTSYSPGNSFIITEDTTLYAIWYLESYTVTYNGNGNTGGSVPASIPYPSGTLVTVLGPGSLVKTNYTFSNWNTKIDGTGLSYLPTSQFTITADTTLYAQWTPVLYTVTYNGNGNTGGTVPVDGSSPYPYGSSVTVLGPGTLVKTNSTFIGWNTAANGTGLSYSPGSTFTIIANTILFAQWTPVLYTVTYNGNGNTSGTAPTDSTFYPPGTRVTVLGNTGSLTKTNYTFFGWNTKADDSGSGYLPGSTFIISADTILYASWNCKVTYNGNGNTGGTAPTDRTFYQPGLTVTVLGSGTLVKTNSTFIGWNTAADGTGTFYFPADSFIITTNTILYAQWTPPLYTVTYNGNGNTGGTVPTDGSSYPFNSTVTVLGNTGSLVKTGFVFSNWNTAADGTGLSYLPGNTFIINENTILFAQWANTVIYDGNGNTGGTAPVDASSPYLSGSTVRVLGSETLVKTNATFFNWNTKADGSGTSYFQFNTFIITANIILYAQWTSLYTVTYDGNGADSGLVPVDLSSPYVNNSLVTVLGNTGSLAKTDYFFSGWNTNANGTGLSYSPANTFNINANITLYAQFTSIPVPSYSITYNGNINNGGTVPIDGLSPYISSSTITVLGNTGSLTKSGYIFTGWNTKSDGTGISYTPSNTFIINANITLYAKWTSDTFSYYQNNLKDNTGKIIFSGYFKVRNSNNLITEFYQTIDDKTDLTKNILMDVGSQETFYSNPSPVFNDNIYNSNSNQPFTNGGVAVTPNLVIFGNRVSVLTLHYSFIPNRVTPVRATLIFSIEGNGFRIKGRNALGVQGVPVAPNGYGYTLTPIQNPICFNEGTKILCLNKQFEEEYIPIEHLRKGDIVKSYKHGYRRVDLIGKNSMINDPNRFTNCMYKMEKTAENGLIEDLIVTGGHSILVDDLGDHKEKNDKIFGSTLMIDDKYLLLSAVSNDFKKIENVNLYTYYHFTLENDGDDDERFGVWANGILTETPSKNYFTKNFIAS